MKVCNTCKESKSLDEFHKDKARKDGKQRKCKICNKLVAKKWAKNNPERCRENDKKYNSILENRLRNSIITQYNKKVPKGYRHDLIEILGCDINTYIKYIESLWMKEFSWDNYGKIWEIDHIIPRNSVAFKALKSQRHIFGYKNTRPLFKTSQIAKSNGYDDIVGNKNRQKTKGVDTKVNNIGERDRQYK
tara:strand:+ start:221 stop:790 length:570 start_codon:yes stop_codon:yes gene_type:complete